MPVENDYDMSAVIPLTHRKTQDIVRERGYKVTGFVLTDEAGRKCIVDMSAVRWFDEREKFFRMMHAQDAPQPPVVSAERESEWRPSSALLTKPVGKVFIIDGKMEGSSIEKPLASGTYSLYRDVPPSADAKGEALDFETIESCFPDGAIMDACGNLTVSAQWLHDFARQIAAINAAMQKGAKK